MSEKDLDIAIEKCERIMEFDTRTLENPESENGWLFEKVYDLLEFLRQFQFVEQMPSAQPSVSKTEIIGDAISRQAAADVVDFECGEWRGLAKTIIKKLEALPSAQPEIIRCKDCRHNHNCDIQYHAQAGDMFFCAGAERRTE